MYNNLLFSWLPANSSLPLLNIWLPIQPPKCCHFPPCPLQTDQMCSTSQDHCICVFLQLECSCEYMQVRLFLIFLKYLPWSANINLQSFPIYSTLSFSVTYSVLFFLGFSNISYVMYYLLSLPVLLHYRRNVFFTRESLAPKRMPNDTVSQVVVEWINMYLFFKDAHLSVFLHLGTNILCMEGIFILLVLEMICNIYYRVFVLVWCLAIVMHYCFF